MAFQFKLSFLLLAIVGLLQVLGAPNNLARAPDTLPGSKMTKVQVKGTGKLNSGGYYYVHWVEDSATYTEAEVEKALYEAGVRGMKGWIVVWSIKGLPQDTQSPQACTIVEDGNHLRWANCAEINAMALAMNKGKAWLEDADVKIAAFSKGKTFYNGPHRGKKGYGYIAPCNKGVDPTTRLMYDGCKQALAKYSNWKALPANTAYDMLTL